VTVRIEIGVDGSRPPDNVVARINAKFGEISRDLKLGSAWRGFSPLTGDQGSPPDQERHCSEPGPKPSRLTHQREKSVGAVEVDGLAARASGIRVFVNSATLTASM
jgi:hypothetical protein